MQTAQKVATGFAEIQGQNADITLEEQKRQVLSSGSEGALDKLLYHGEEVKRAPGMGFWQFMARYVMENDVCPLGKFGAWLLLGWSVTMIVFLGKGMAAPLDARKRKLYQILGVINLILSITYTCITLLANTALFVRCIPFLAAQLGVSAWLIMKSD